MESFNPLKRRKKELLKKSTIYWDNPRTLSYIVRKDNYKLKTA